MHDQSNFLEPSGEPCPAEHLSTLRRFVDVGWILDMDHASFVWPAPNRVRRDRGTSSHSKSLTKCPAILDSDGRLFEFTCPFDLKLAVKRDGQGRWSVVNLLGSQSPVRANYLSKLVKLVSQTEWAHPERPVLQIVTPYVIVADEPVYLNQLPPFNYWKAKQLPGLMVPGRFPIDIWPRHLMWAFEWYALDQPLELQRGEPWWYLRFDHIDPSRSVRMIPALMTADLREYIQGIKGVTNYVDQTFQLFKIAKSRRPKQLLFRKSGAAGSENIELDDGSIQLAKAESTLMEIQFQLQHNNTHDTDSSNDD